MRNAPLLAEPRRRLGPSPRKIEPDTLRRVQPPRVTWLAGEDPLFPVVHRFQDILQTGQITWGYLVKANNILWSRGEEPAAALLLHGTESGEDPPLLRLMDAAHRLTSLDPDGPLVPGWKPTLEFVKDDCAHRIRVPLPASLSWGLSMQLSTIIVFPQHLPEPFLMGTFFPVLLPPNPLPTTILPSLFWGDELKQAWREWNV